jgi:hypothetical protein
VRAGPGSLLLHFVHGSSEGVALRATQVTAGNFIKRRVRAEPRLNDGKRDPSAPEQNPYHAPQRLGGAPQQLVADGERTEVVAAHREFAKAPDRNF